MQWKADLESLFAQTKAMIRSANHKSIRTAPLPEVATADVAQPGAVTSSVSSPAMPPAIGSPDKASTSQMTLQMTWRSPARDEITQRVAGFKAHQEKMRREREDYYRETIAKTRALLRDDGKTSPTVPLPSPGSTRPN
jgi:hypothetical protein